MVRLFPEQTTQMYKEIVMKKICIVITFFYLLFAANAMAMDGMKHGSEHGDGKFVHTAMVDDIHVEFQVMDLASMNMKDPDGKTHHVMASFMRNDEKITKAVGKVKLIAPSGKEQTADLIDYGGGAFAANFTVDEQGKWGVICLFKDSEGQHTVKFWYESHHM